MKLWTFEAPLRPTRRGPRGSCRPRGRTSCSRGSSSPGWRCRSSSSASAVVAEVSEIDEFSDWAAARSVEPVVTGDTGAPSLVAMPLASVLAATAGAVSAGSLEASCVGSDFDFLAVRDGAFSRREARSFLRERVLACLATAAAAVGHGAQSTEGDTADTDADANPHPGLCRRREGGNCEDEGGGEGEQLSHDFLRRFSAWCPAGLP